MDGRNDDSGRVVELPDLSPDVRLALASRARAPAMAGCSQKFFNICSYTLHVSCIQLNPDVFDLRCVNITDLSCDTINHQLFSCDLQLHALGMHVNFEEQPVDYAPVVVVSLLWRFVHKPSFAVWVLRALDEQYVAHTDRLNLTCVTNDTCVVASVLEFPHVHV